MTTFCRAVLSVMVRVRKEFFTAALARNFNFKWSIFFGRSYRYGFIVAWPRAIFCFIRSRTYVGKMFIANFTVCRNFNTRFKTKTSPATVFCRVFSMRFYIKDR